MNTVGTAGSCTCASGYSGTVSYDATSITGWCTGALCCPVCVLVWAALCCGWGLVVIWWARDMCTCVDAAQTVTCSASWSAQGNTCTGSTHRSWGVWSSRTTSQCAALCASVVDAPAGDLCCKWATSGSCSLHIGSAETYVSTFVTKKTSCTSQVYPSDGVYRATTCNGFGLTGNGCTGSLVTQFGYQRSGLSGCLALCRSVVTVPSGCCSYKDVVSASGNEICQYWSGGQVSTTSAYQSALCTTAIACTPIPHCAADLT